MLIHFPNTVQSIEHPMRRVGADLTRCNLTQHTPHLFGQGLAHGIESIQPPTQVQLSRKIPRLVLLRSDSDRPKRRSNAPYLSQQCRLGDGAIGFTGSLPPATRSVPQKPVEFILGLLLATQTAPQPCLRLFAPRYALQRLNAVQ